MANRDAPNGFRVSSHLTGGTPGRLNRYTIVGALAKNIYTGDIVIPVDTSKRISRPTAGTERPIGVFDGCYYVLADGSPKFERYWPTGQAVQTGSTPEALVTDDPFTVFEVQASGAFAQADIGQFANYTVGTGNSLTGQSGDELDSTTVGTGATLKILDYAKYPDNEVGDNAKLLVSFAIHYLRGAQTAI
jgi:hypothetical protein